MDWKDGLGIAAFALSLFNLWWSTLRNRNALYFVATGPLSFTLINGGRRDVLILNIAYSFRDATNTMQHQPRQEPSVDLKAGYLLGAGKAHRIDVSMNNEWAGNGPLPTPIGDMGKFTIWMLLGWADMSGNMHLVRKPIYDAEVTESSRRYTPIERRIDLTPKPKLLMKLAKYGAKARSIWLNGLLR